MIHISNVIIIIVTLLPNHIRHLIRYHSKHGQVTNIILVPKGNDLLQSGDMHAYHISTAQIHWNRNMILTKFSALTAPGVIKITHFSLAGDANFVKMAAFPFSLKQKCLHFDEILITGCTGSCQNDNFQCSQWWKFSQNDDIFVSVLVL